VELSDFARLLAKMRDMSDVRHDRVQRVRSAIDRGNYDTPERVSQAMDRMIREEDLLAP
jgi:anti-sigma28 factor (negative regulator of flagellin synthesis)